MSTSRSSRQTDMSDPRAPLSPIAAKALADAEAEMHDNVAAATAPLRKPTVTIGGETQVVNAEAVDAVRYLHRVRDVAKIKENVAAGTLNSSIVHDLKYVRLERQIESLQEELAASKSLSAQQAKDLSLQATEIDVLRSRVGSLEAEVMAGNLNQQASERSISSLKVDLSSAASEASELRSKISELEGGIASLQSQLQLQRLKTAEAQADWSITCAEIEILKQKRSEDSERHAEEFRKLKQAGLEAVAAAEKAGEETLSEVMAASETKIAMLSEQVADQRQTLDALEGRCSQLSADLIARSLELNQSTEVCTSLQSKLSISADEALTASGRISLLEAETDAQKRLISELQSELHDIRTEAAEASAEHASSAATSKDTISQLEDTVASLKIEVGDMTSKYLGEKAAVEWANQRYDDIKSELRNTRAGCAAAVAGEEAAVRELKSAMDDNAALQSALDAEKARVVAVQESLDAETSRVAMMQDELARVNITVENAAGAAAARIADLEQELAIVTADRDRYLEKVGAATLSSRSADERVDAALRDAAAAQAEAQTAIQRAAADADARVAAAEAACAAKVTEAEEAGNSRLRQLQSMTAVRIKEAQAALVAAEKRTYSAFSEAEKQRADNDRVREENEELKSTSAAARQRCEKLQRSYDDMKVQLEATKKKLVSAQAQALARPPPSSPGGLHLQPTSLRNRRSVDRDGSVSSQTGTGADAPASSASSVARAPSSAPSSARPASASTGSGFEVAPSGLATTVGQTLGNPGGPAGAGGYPLLLPPPPPPSGSWSSVSSLPAAAVAARPADVDSVSPPADNESAIAAGSESVDDQVHVPAINGGGSDDVGALRKQSSASAAPAPAVNQYVAACRPPMTSLEVQEAAEVIAARLG